MSETIFGGTDKEPQKQPEGVVTDNQQEAEPQLNLVGEGKKYKSIEDLDKAYLNAESHIQKIERENAELREKISAAKGVEEVLAALGQTGAQQQEEGETTPSAVDPQLIQSLVEKTIEQRESLSKQRQNATEVVTKLQEMYGDKAEEVFNIKQTELGVDLNALAMSSPKAALALLANNAAQEPARRSDTGTVNTESLMTKHRNRTGTYDYWKQQYKEGKINMEDMLKGQHRSLNEMGSDSFYQK